MTKTTIIATLAAVSLMAGAAPAFAGQPGETVTFKVSTWGLNLADPGDARIMLDRIERASASACGDAPANADLSGRQVYGQCVRNNVSEAVRSLNAPQVTALAHHASMRTLASNGR